MASRKIDGTDEFIFREAIESRPMDVGEGKEGATGPPGKSLIIFFYFVFTVFALLVLV